MSQATLTVPLSAIEVDPTLQPRCKGLDEGHILQIMEGLECWPPLVVARDGEALVLVDGFHRLEAARRLGLEHLNVVALNAPADGDYFFLAFQLNALHGKPLSLRDRKAYASRLLGEHADWSDREIGRRAGLNHETVNLIRLGGDAARTTTARRSGALPEVGLLDPIRWSGATRDQKAIAGYFQRLATSLADPYKKNSELDAWSLDADAMARACYASMGVERAERVLEQIAVGARFIIKVAKALKTIQAEENNDDHEVQTEQA